MIIINKVVFNKNHKIISPCYVVQEFIKIKFPHMTLYSPLLPHFKVQRIVINFDNLLFSLV